MRWRVVLAPMCAVRGHREHLTIVQKWQGNRGVQVNVEGCVRCDKVLRERHALARTKIRA